MSVLMWHEAPNPWFFATRTGAVAVVFPPGAEYRDILVRARRETGCLRCVLAEVERDRMGADKPNG